MSYFRPPVSPGIRFETAIMERYHCGTTRAVNPALDRSTLLHMSIISEGISVAASFAANLLHFWFGGSPPEFAVQLAGAGEFEFRVASPDVAAEIVLVGSWAVGPFIATFSLPPKPATVLFGEPLHARHGDPCLIDASSGAAGRAMNSSSVRRDRTGR
jgi:hypothetical protein